MTRYIKQPALRDSASAAVKTWLSPSPSACARTCMEPV